MKDLVILSLFDGISAGRVALNRAGIPVAKYYASEIDKYAISITQKNFPDTIQLGDATKWKNWDIDWSKIDMVIGGSPCTSFSNAGTMTGFNGESGLFYTYLEILNHLKSINPSIKFLLENVKMKQEWRDEISKSVGVEPILINSAKLSAQQRNRLYWVNWIVEEPSGKNISLNDILTSGFGVTVKNQGKEVSCIKNKAECLMARDYKGFGNQEMTGVIEPVSDMTDNTRIVKIQNGILKSGDKEFSIPLSDGTYTIRKLLPIESERCQTFDDNYTKYGLDNNGKIVKISNTQRYKCLGNSWTCDVIAWLFKFLN